MCQVVSCNLLSSQQKEPFSVIGSRQVHHCLPESIRATDTCILHCHHRHCICSYHKFSTLGTVTRKNELYLPVIRRTPQEKKVVFAPIKNLTLHIKTSKKTVICLSPVHKSLRNSIFDSIVSL